MTTIADLYQEWWRQVKPDGPVPGVQVQECKRAFYSGAFALLTAATSDVGDPAASEDDGVGRLEAWDRELKAFFRAMIAEAN